MTGPFTVEDVSVVIPTRDRPESVRRCLEALLAADTPPAEVVVADQGREDRSRDVLASLNGGGRVRWLRLTSVGRSAGLNAGIAAARGSVIAIVDDDVTVDAGWLTAGVEAFAGANPPALVCGALLGGRAPGPGEMLTTFRGRRTRRWRGRLPRALLLGVGANCWLQRETFERVGGFDEALGPGARFRAAEDVDYVNRVLRAGLTVGYEPGMRALHWGTRSAGAEARALLRDYSYGLGAMLAKDLRCGDGWSLGLLSRDFAWEARALAGTAVTFGRTPFSARLPALLRGFRDGWAAPLDRADWRFR